MRRVAIALAVLASAQPVLAQAAQPAEPQKEWLSLPLLCVLTSLAGIFVGIVLFLLRNGRKATQPDAKLPTQPGERQQPEVPS